MRSELRLALPHFCGGGTKSVTCECGVGRQRDAEPVERPVAAAHAQVLRDEIKLRAEDCGERDERRGE